MNDPAVRASVVGAVFLSFCLGMVAAAYMEKNMMKRNAVGAGVAEYYLDEDHSKQFRYLPPSRAAIEAGGQEVEANDGN